MRMFSRLRAAGGRVEGGESRIARERESVRADTG